MTTEDILGGLPNLKRPKKEEEEGEEEEEEEPPELEPGDSGDLLATASLQPAKTPEVMALVRSGWACSCLMYACPAIATDILTPPGLADRSKSTGEEKPRQKKEEDMMGKLRGADTNQSANCVVLYTDLVVVVDRRPRHRRVIAEAEDDDVHEGSSGTAPDTDTATEEEEDEEEEEEEDHRLRLGLHSMTAKGIQHLCSELLEIKKASEQDFRANVYVSYLSFVRMFQEAGELEQDVQRLRRQAIAHGRLVQHLGSSLYSSSSMLLAAGSVADDEDMENVEDDDADDEDEVLNLLLSSEQQLLRAPRRRQQQQHRRIAERLASVAGNPRTPRAELLRAASGLCRLGEPERANRLVLDWYSARVVRGVEELRLQQQSQQQQSNYIKEVARMVFSSIAEAARSLQLVVGLHHHHGLLLRWAREEMEDFGAAFSEYVASVPMSSQQLALALEAAECAVVSYAPQLVGISGDVVDVLRGLMAPSIREAVATYARHLKEVVRLLVASDAWVLGRFPVPGAGSCLLTASGRKLVTLVQEVVDDVASPLQRIGMDSAATQLVAGLFREYVRCSIVPACTTPPLRRMNNEHVSILINCATLASLFPAIAASTPAAAACREAAAQVWDCFCQQFVRDTMGMPSEQHHHRYGTTMPSLGLQVVFLRVRRLKDAYGAILSGEDGTMKRLLGELMEAIVSWLSANMPDSAQQAQLDVHFLLEIAQLGGVDITATALALLRRPGEVDDDDDGVSSWAAHAARHAAVQLLSNLHNTSTDDDAEAASSNSAAAVPLEDDDDDMASRKSSDEFISIEDDDQDKPTMLNTPLLMGQRQSDNDDGIFHDDHPPTTATVTVAAAASETGGRNMKKKAAVSTGSSRPRWH
ncbi:hypothetical protein HU200_011845 [Digitaria exilis]|uniref:Uncharacterized protein n=1 Tax=Digitaria exilis TaxID=1010633 RepID=A0A835KMH3_9POAL|nr:hypothetical protein HU200_011845 [Digitaria exilis]